MGEGKGKGKGRGREGGGEGRASITVIRQMFRYDLVSQA